MVYPYSGILFYNKEEQITGKCYNKDEYQKPDKWQKPNRKEYVLCGCIYIKCLEKADLYRKQNSGYLRPGQEWKHSGGKFWGWCDGKVLRLDCSDDVQLYKFS